MRSSFGCGWHQLPSCFWSHIARSSSVSKFQPAGNCARSCPGFRPERQGVPTRSFPSSSTPVSEWSGVITTFSGAMLLKTISQVSSARVSGEALGLSRPRISRKHVQVLRAGGRWLVQRLAANPAKLRRGDGGLGGASESAAAGLRSIHASLLSSGSEGAAAAAVAGASSSAGAKRKRSEAKKQKKGKKEKKEKKLKKEKKKSKKHKKEK